MLLSRMSVPPPLPMVRKGWWGLRRLLASWWLHRWATKDIEEDLERGRKLEDALLAELADDGPVLPQWGRTPRPLALTAETGVMEAGVVGATDGRTEVAFTCALSVRIDYAIAAASDQEGVVRL